MHRIDMVKIGKYEILEKIGSGGFGKVYKGRDPHLKRIVAIKTCESEDDEIRQRFTREAEIVASLQHPNITTVHDFGIYEEIPYLVQEFLSGEDLKVVIKRRDSLPVQTCIGYLMQMASGLECAHSHQIIHRDVKPSNIRLLEDGTVKVMDFGVAKLANIESHLTQTGALVGTIAYLSPEQINIPHDVDHRCDIYSFGVTAYELLTNVRPFKGSTISALLNQILNLEPEPVEVVLPGCPLAVAELVAACMHKEREERPQSFRDVLEKLVPLAIPTETPTVSLIREDLGPLAGDTGTGAGGAPSSHSASAQVVPEAESHKTRTTTSRPFSPPSRTFLTISLAGAVLAGLLAIWFFRPVPSEETPGEPLLSSPVVESREDLVAEVQISARPSEPPASLTPAAVEAEESATLTTDTSLARKPTPDHTAPAEPAPQRVTPIPDREQERATSQEESEPPVQDELPASEPEPPTISLDPPTESPPPSSSDPEETPVTPTREESSESLMADVRPSTPQVVREAAPKRTIPKSPPEPAIRDETPAVLEAIQRYKEAFEGLDSQALQRVWPSLKPEKLQILSRSFASYQWLQMEITDCDVEVEGESARATCLIRRVVKPKAGTRQRDQRQSVFHLRKQADRWVIETL